MIVAIIITSLIWIIVFLVGIIFLCGEKEKTLDDLYTGVKKSALSEDTKKRVLDLLEHYLST